jgi:hypothetical protein
VPKSKQKYHLLVLALRYSNLYVWRVPFGLAAVEENIMLKVHVLTSTPLDQNDLSADLFRVRLAPYDHPHIFDIAMSSALYCGDSLKLH